MVADRAQYATEIQAAALFEVTDYDHGRKIKRRRTLAEWRRMQEPLAAVGLTAPCILEFMRERKRCSFWFLSADKLLQHEGTTPPKLQTLRRDHPDWLKQHTISFELGCSGEYTESFLAVSHRWEEPVEPDRLGVQFKAVKEHLRANPSIKWVWFDYWSMPQGRKSMSEDVEFNVMLPNIDLLYLFCSVLILQDRTYMSRFWTQFEAFLSFRKVTAMGLGFTPEEERRCTIVAIHDAPSHLTTALLEEWANKTAHEAHSVLKKPDVQVTNQKDKEAQLPKLLSRDDFAKREFACIERDGCDA